MNVPRAEKRTSGIKPNFLWDKTAYTLGVNANPDKAAAKNPAIPFWQKIHLALFVSDISNFCRKSKRWLTSALSILGKMAAFAVSRYVCCR